LRLASPRLVFCDGVVDQARHDARGREAEDHELSGSLDPSWSMKPAAESRDLHLSRLASRISSTSSRLSGQHWAILMSSRIGPRRLGW
jgi:hypothetical protein